ncbi:MAG: hypothetical protein FWH47_02690 [Methanomassiliicoccaceae archaeon]|nr:hypothetical protein [Methanomassiliicoccaceae archaeon]
MASAVPQFKAWDDAMVLARGLRFDQALELLRGVEADMAALHEWRTYKSDRDNSFDQAMFFSDYCGVLAEAGLYAEAE